MQGVEERGTGPEGAPGRGVHLNTYMQGVAGRGTGPEGSPGSGVGDAGREERGGGAPGDRHRGDEANLPLAAPGSRRPDQRTEGRRSAGRGRESGPAMRLRRLLGGL